ncbi:MAG TPA: hypothetical protein VFS42_11860 [Burkholderiaceae bacterium]|nr:hypothetical protein [Burkholderiaceae bacterium]
MFPWFWIWAPQIHCPWSGSVAQRIEPNVDWFLNAIPPNAGVAEIEKQAFHIASYGRQLGLITEVLLEMTKAVPLSSPRAQEALECLKDIHRKIEQVKDKEASESVDALAAQLERLKRRDPAAFHQLTATLTTRSITPTP